MIVFKQPQSPTTRSPGTRTPEHSHAWPRRSGDDIDWEERDIERYLTKVLGENNGDYCRYEMLVDAARISWLGSLHNKGDCRQFDEVISPDIIAKANAILNNHESWEEVQDLLELAEDEDDRGSSPFSEDEPTEVLRLFQRFTAWASPNLRFDRYVLKRERNDEPFYTIRGYLRDVLVLLSMKRLWEDNLRLEWQPDIHPAAIHRAVAFAGKIGQRATTELFGAFLERMECTSLDPDNHFFPQSPAERQSMTRRFLSGLSKCKPMQNSDISHLVATHSTNHHTKGVRFILPDEDSRKEAKFSPLRELAKQYKLSVHTFIRLSIFIYSDTI
ncbi:hypothetical protein GCG54_00006753 [Colletotrichum gloeosporioides]|uniref:Uncharacterized protein n=1 Tax=Colletotrichum gloeosporioides TaxID=474922 RepID=A0A8H4CEZ8_COLGL|nr:uncharacterized protein GCG54_00006753 [Colletotrichum gloeosporioides]KAF3802643.1 hypothetical protein GCG54_00006753 [Colletotrichum gloeosporioides]